MATPTSSPNPKLERFIDELLDDRIFPTRGKIAEAVGMTDSGFSRAIRDEGTLSVESCFLLARAVKERPATILRVAGKDDLAEVVAALCQAKTFALTRREIEHVEQWRRLSIVERMPLESIIYNFAKRARTGGGLGKRR